MYEPMLKNDKWEGLDVDSKAAFTFVLESLADEDIEVTDLEMTNNPIEGVYVFYCKDSEGIEVAFELENISDDVYQLCLTIDSNVVEFDTFADISEQWHLHDLVV